MPIVYSSYKPTIYETPFTFKLKDGVYVEQTSYITILNIIYTKPDNTYCKVFAEIEPNYIIKSAFVENVGPALVEQFGYYRAITTNNIDVEFKDFDTRKNISFNGSLILEDIHQFTTKCFDYGVLRPDLSEHCDEFVYVPVTLEGYTNPYNADLVFTSTNNFIGIKLDRLTFNDPQNYVEFLYTDEFYADVRKGEIDAITGATKTSKPIIDAVRSYLVGGRGLENS